jgi:ArsR family transcriptional regulator
VKIIDELQYICQGAYMFGMLDAMAKREKEVPLERLFRALADPTRLRLINLMSAGEICVCYLVEALDLPQPKISRHLAYMRRVGFVSARREGTWMHYSLASPANRHAAAILTATVNALKQNAEWRKDLQRLKKACCGPKSLVQILGAPAPELMS